MNVLRVQIAYFDVTKVVRDVSTMLSMCNDDNMDFYSTISISSWRFTTLGGLSQTRDMAVCNEWNKIFYVLDAPNFQ